MKKIYLFLMLCCLSVACYAQTAASYGLTATTGSYATISGTGTAISAGGMTTVNGVNTSISIGFNFVYCGTTYTTVSASSNGWFSLANSSLAAAPSPTNATGSLASIASGAGLLMPMWSNLSGVGQTAYFQTTGTVGSRVFTMEWKNWGVNSATATLNFQIKLYEGTNAVEFWYGPYSGTVPTSATIGICNTTSDYQTLPAGTSTFSNTGFNATCSPPANGTILRWCAPPPAITGGTTAFCQGATTTLADAQAGGVWSSGAPSIATVGSATGVVTGVTGGTAIISYTPACGPAVTKTVTVNALPTTYTVTGGGGYCAGGSGVTVGLNNSTSGVTYTLFNGATPLAPTVAGTGAAISFGLQLTGGTYTVVGSIGGCTATMLGSVVVTVNPLPTQYSITGGAPYCLGGSGSAIGMANTTIGVNYQLYLGATPVGSPSVGTGSAISFGSLTSVGIYSVSATNSTTLCTSAMLGTVNVTTSPLPIIYTVTGGGGFCIGGTGLAVGLTNSTIGTNYQLFITPTGSTTTSPVGSPVAGTGGALNFGNQTVGGTYTVVATIASTGCTTAMSGSAIIAVNTLPGTFTVTVSATAPNAPGAYCLGGAGQTITLLGSQIGVNYQLYLGSSPIGSPVAGTGTSISFGLQTTVGSYTVVGTNATTGCVNNMTGSVSISTIPLPPAFSVTGGGAYCAGGAGLAVGLASSSSSTNYSLYNGTTLIGGASGTGSAVTFGLQTLAGIYSVTALSTTTGCTSNMSGTVTVTINPLPALFATSNPASSAYCAGGAGVPVSLSGSQSGVNYLLYNGSTLVTSLPGTGALLTYTGVTGAGSYTIVGVNATTTCSSNMTGSAIVSINPLPTIFTVTGGGGFCAGTAGVTIGLSASNSGINYQLYNSSGAIVGANVAGTGSPISFGPQSVNSLIDYVVATNPITTCTVNMSGNVIVTVNPLPTAYTLSGSASYCFGGAGVPLTLGGSQTGVQYQLYNGTTMIGGPVSGTSSPLSFPGITLGGTYTISAVNTTTGCTNNMLGGATVVVTPLPAVYAVTGGGTYCAGTGGVHVGLGSSAPGVSYQLFYNGTPGATLVGSGSALDYGFETGAGSYTVLATTTIGSCQSNMSGTATVSVNVLPSTSYTITESATGYCAGGTGVTIGLSGSAVGINYQLYNGAASIGAPMPGTTSALNFGAQTLAGTYTIVGSNATTGCFATMSGTAPVAINALPAVRPVTGGGSYCPGTTGVSVGVNPTDAGVNYQLYNGLLPVGGTVAGSGGSSISFGLQTTPGIYTVIATNGSTGCSANMSGTATVSIYSLPLVYNVTGGGNYCAGGTGVNVGLSGSNLGISYQLMNGAAPMGSAVTGSGLPLSFGLQTVAGPYTVIATSTSTTCTDTMNGTATVGTNALPAAQNVTGGGAYCAGSTGRLVGLDASVVGTNYQLVIGGSTPVGTLVPGTGSALNFGLQTTAGTYTVIAANTATTCTNTMTGSAIISINTLPGLFTVSGGGAYCSGSTGVAINLSGSDPTATYQLVNGTTLVGPVITGTGSSISFSPVTAAGTYSILATNTANTCNNLMTGTATVSINALPNTYIVAGGGAYCSGGTGVHIMLSGTNAGINYQMKRGSVLTGPVIAGTGMAIDFGLVTGNGVYHVQATNASTGCIAIMTDSATVNINPLPEIHTVVSTSSSYCAGGLGVHVSIDGSNVGTTYQLYSGTTTVGPAQAGTGSAVSFGYITFPGSYTIVATNTSTGCYVNMAPGVTVSINSLPTVYAVTGGGNYCSGGTGVNVGIAGSNVGISYQLYAGLLAVGSPLAGTGSPLSFGLQTASGVYTVLATNTLTTCTNNMSGSATIVINALPSSSYTSTGGGSYCAGGAGITLGLSGSALATNYQLMRGSAVVGSPVLGTGSAISFGAQTAAGTYTVIATSTITSCSNTMSGSSVISINAVPSTFSMTGGGNFCPGGAGVNVGLSGSTSGVNYQLYNGAGVVGTPMAGITGSPVNFGMQTAGGTYTVVATNASTGCTNTMSGSAVVVVNALPTQYSVSGGGNYCAGGTGVAVGLSNSSAGVNYTLYNGSSSLLTVAGTGGPVSFGLQTLAGTYSVLGTNSTTSCTNYMSDSVTVVINPVIVPVVSISISGSGDTTCAGTFTTFTANPIGGGVGPTYQWSVNGTPSATGSVYGYVPLNGDLVSVTLTSDATCAMPTTASAEVAMTVDAKQTPFVSVAATPGTEVCLGTIVNFTATPSYGGPFPAYQWFKDGSAVGGANSSTYSYAPANGDNVYVVITSDYHCRLADNAGSTHINMVVDVPSLPVVTITATPGFSISAGEAVTLTASVVNGGPSPTYQWMINGIPQGGATNSTYSNNTFVNKDSVTCQVTSSGGCPGMLGFNSVVMHVAGVGVNPVSLSGSDVMLIPNPNNGNFTLKGSLGTTTFESVTIEVVNMLGQVVYSSKITSGNGEINESIKLNSVANGMYLLNLRSGTENKVFHFVVEQ